MASHFTYVPDLLTKPTAELALGLMIALARNILPGDAHVRSGAFRGWRPLLYGGSIEGARVGVIGAGRVGQALLKLLRGFDCERVFYDTHPIAPEAARTLDARLVDLETLTKTSDFVVLAMPLTPETLGMIDAARLAQMKRGAYLVNPGRGSVVVEDDCYSRAGVRPSWRLRSGRLRDGGPIPPGRAQNDPSRVAQCAEHGLYTAHWFGSDFGPPPDRTGRSG